jgi:hypothetical protein
VFPAPFATLAPTSNSIGVLQSLSTRNQLITPITPSNVGQSELAPLPILPSDSVEDPPISIGFGDPDWIVAPKPEPARPQPANKDDREAPAPPPPALDVPGIDRESDAPAVPAAPMPPRDGAERDEEGQPLYDLGCHVGLVATLLGGSHLARELKTRHRRIALGRDEED